MQKTSQYSARDVFPPPLVAQLIKLRYTSAIYIYYYILAHNPAKARDFTCQCQVLWASNAKPMSKCHLFDSAS